MRFGTWNVRSLYRAGSLKTVTRELGKYKLRLSGCTGGQMGNGGALKGQRIIHFFMERGMKNISLGQVSLYIRES
jgi:hypothetical protein